MNWAMMVVPKVKLLLLCSLLFWKACECAPLETTTGRSGNTSCVGDTVNYTCTLDATAHRWRIPSLGLDENIARTRITFSDSQVTIVTTADGGPGNPITTALTVTSSAELNGTTITCSDANLDTEDVQETTVMVFGSPSAPGLTVVGGEDMASYNFTIIPSEPPQCVLNYIITATSSDGSSTITVPASEVDGSTTVTQGGFDVCTVMYSFTVAPVTSESTGTSSASMDRRLEITGLQATPTVLMWLAPSNIPTTCFPQYIISLTDNPTVNLTVTGTTTASSAELNAAGFLYCVDQSVTVTPVLFNGTTYSIGSASMIVTITDPGIRGITPSVVIQQQPTGNVTITLQGMEFKGRDIVIGRSSPGGGDCTDVATLNGTEFMEYIVPLDCSYDNVSVTICVRYTTGDGCSSMATNTTITTVDVGDDVCPPTTTTDGTPTLDNNTGGSVIGPVVGGVVGGVAAVAVVIIIIILIMVLCKKKGKGSGDDGMDSGKTKLTYHSAGATAATSGGVTSGGVTSVELSHVDSGAMYADPKAIEHQQTSTGDEYAMVSSNTKAKKKAPSRPPVAPVETGDLYSVPDKTKKIQNEGLVYADIDVANPQRPPPRSHGIQPQQIDNESVTYATVATV